LLRPTLGEHIEIGALRATDVSLALVDPNLLTTTILNLAVMARDAMPEGGKLTFETRNAVSRRVAPASSTRSASRTMSWSRSTPLAARPIQTGPLPMSA
jgi:hypothetical protein